MALPNSNFISNELEDFQGGGLYPGGTGKVIEFYYKLWDYNGTQPPDSNVAVYLNFQPTDGSNEDKPVEIFWNVGNAKDFIPSPDGGFLMKTEHTQRHGQSDNSNWAVIAKALRDNCGLEPGKLSGPNGIRAMEGSELTLTRIKQKEREGLPQAPGAENAQAGGRGNQPKTILTPTRAKFAWAGGAAAKKTTAAAPAAAPKSTASATTATSSTDPSTILSGILTDNGGSIEVAKIPKAIMEAMKDATKDDRMAVIKAVKETLDELALASDWKLADGTLSM